MKNMREIKRERGKNRTQENERKKYHSPNYPPIGKSETKKMRAPQIKLIYQNFQK